MYSWYYVATIETRPGCRREGHRSHTPPPSRTTKDDERILLHAGHGSDQLQRQPHGAGARRNGRTWHDRDAGRSPGRSTRDQPVPPRGRPFRTTRTTDE